MKLFFDGGLRPHGMELAVVVGGHSIVQQGLGPGTSVDAEWLALIHAVRTAHRMKLSGAVLLGDAAAVIAQANGTQRIPASCLAHHHLFQTMEKPDGRLRIRYIKRTQNLAGIALARLHER